MPFSRKRISYSAGPRSLRLIHVRSFAEGFAVFISASARLHQARSAVFISASARLHQARSAVFIPSPPPGRLMTARRARRISDKPQTAKENAASVFNPLNMDTSEDFSQYIRWREENGKTICLDCGAEMEWFIRGGSCGWECENCGYNVATSWFEPIETDLTAYSITLEPSESPAVSKLKLIAEIAGVNWLEAKKLIENAPAELFRGQAVRIKEIRDKLKAAGMKYKIEPEFPY